MFNRQKVLLGIVLEAPKMLSRAQLTRLAFLFSQECNTFNETLYYDFLPYEHGPFSFALYRDLDGLEHLGYLEHDHLAIAAQHGCEAEKMYLSLRKDVRSGARDIADRYGRLSQQTLKRHVYDRFPSFASRSERVGKSKTRVKKRKSAVYTAGYEGESVDRFLDKLLRAGIEHLIDIRRNPISRKYGFSKRTLGCLCENLQIQYTHIPELGIPSSRRKDLHTFEDYQDLLRMYDRSILSKAPAAVKRVSGLVTQATSALLCVEADVRCCHRSRLAHRISIETGLPTTHL